MILIRSNDNKYLFKKLNLKNGAKRTISLIGATIIMYCVIPSTLEDTSNGILNEKDEYVLEDEIYDTENLAIISAYNGDKTIRIIGTESISNVDDLDEIYGLFDELEDFSKYDIDEFSCEKREYEFINFNGRFTMITFNAAVSYDDSKLYLIGNIHEYLIHKNGKYTSKYTNIIGETDTKIVNNMGKSVNIIENETGTRKSEKAIFFDVNYLDEYFGMMDRKFLNKENIEFLEKKLREEDNLITNDDNAHLL